MPLGGCGRQEPLPPFRASIMDGYAVVAADGEGEVLRRRA